MVSRRTDEPLLNGWLVVCFLLAIPIVYLFGDQIYAGIGIAINFIGGTFMASAAALMRWLLWPLNSPATLGGVLFVLFVALPILLLILFLTLVFLVPLAIVFFILNWLITGTGGQLHTVVHFVLDVGLVCLFGAFLYGVFFPLVWLALAPVLAQTFGEIVFQRVRQRVYGERPRFGRPAYLLVSLLSLGFGGVRLLAPVAEQGAQAWRAEVHEVYFPPTPTPNPWPKRVAVPRKQLVRTGITVADKSQEIAISSNAHVFFKIGDEPKWTFVRGNSGGDYFSHARTGEVLLYGGDEAATVVIAQPEFRGRRWLAPGETMRVGVWVDKEMKFAWCGGPEISFRTTRGGRPSSDWGPSSSWGFADCMPAAWYVAGGHGWPVPGAGLLEVKAGKEASWFNFLTVIPSGQWVHVPPTRLTDSGIPVRRGDRIRVAAGREAMYWLSSDGGELLIGAKHYREETVSRAGTVRLKGGVVDSDATVTVVARGPEWK